MRFIIIIIIIIIIIYRVKQDHINPDFALFAVIRHLKKNESVISTAQPRVTKYRKST